ncbi:arylesterase [Amphritea sp. HPY]|uniref:arylesterase n=1 Tax=Amphritea sp. HPY TaxID=3421652 RepID=UPI003D7CB09B
MAPVSAILLFLFSSLAWGDSILVMGDSLSAAYGMPSEKGWVSLLQQRLDNKGYSHQVINASVSGETTHGGVTRLTRQLQRVKPQLVMIELGANDGLRGTALTVLQRNLMTLVQQSQAAGARVILLEMKLPPNYGPSYSQQFQSIFGQVAQQQNATLVPFFMAPVVLRPELMQADGLHPNARAQPVLLDQLWPHLQALLNVQVRSE